ncbi:MAG: hypothetical protein GXY83_26725 [Rhodopirellula sp.]|nr:hypothetical protein [Rhodopirellula sp.]
MLTCYGHTVRLPQSDLAYVAFRLALQETLTDIEIHDLEEEPDYPVGYLSEVPFLEQVPLPVQVDLLADTWARHRKPDLVEASLLDAAIVYTACETAGRIINDSPEVAVAWLHDGPRKVPSRIIKRASHQLEELFDEFWDDRDFLLIEQFQDLSPDHARYIKTMLRLPDEVIEPMYAALERWNVSPHVAANLVGLLANAEIQDAMPVLEAGVRRPCKSATDDAPGDPHQLLTGLDDRYHDLLVGPCNSTTAETENACRLVQVVEVADESDFDCTYDEWVDHLRADVRRAADEDVAHGPPSVSYRSNDPLLAARIERARTTGLEDGTRIEARGDGWVVVDSFYSYLVDPDDAAWVLGDDDGEEMPPTLFPSAAAAYGAWERSEKVAAARKQRREEALKRLSRNKTQ